MVAGDEVRGGVFGRLQCGELRRLKRPGERRRRCGCSPALQRRPGDDSRWPETTESAATVADGVGEEELEGVASLLLRANGQAEAMESSAGRSSDRSERREGGGGRGIEQGRRRRFLARRRSSEARRMGASEGIRVRGGRRSSSGSSLTASGNRGMRDTEAAIAVSVRGGDREREEGDERQVGRAGHCSSRLRCTVDL
jgi:hypothetical protein